MTKDGKVSESKLQQIADDLITATIIYSGFKKVGELINHFKKSYPEIDQLKAKHFNPPKGK
jgi:hypothetical protein